MQELISDKYIVNIPDMVVICNGESYYMHSDKRFKGIKIAGWGCFEKISDSVKKEGVT